MLRMLEYCRIFDLNVLVLYILDIMTKRFPTFSCNSTAAQLQILINFDRSRQLNGVISHLTWLVFVHYLAKLETRKLHLLTWLLSVALLCFALPLPLTVSFNVLLKNKMTCLIAVYVCWDTAIIYVGWSDVTESMATIRLPFCGYNVT